MCITFNSTYKGHPINTNKDKEFGCYNEILGTYRELLDDTLSRHSQVMQVRFDLRYPKDGSIDPDPAHIHKFNYNLKRRLNRITNKGNHFVDARLMSVQEQNEERGTEHPHFHYVALLNANAVQRWIPIVEMANDSWKRVLKTKAEGLIDYCNKSKDKSSNGIRIRKCDPDFQQKYDECFYQASYLAKIRNKENPPKGSWKSRHPRISKSTEKGQNHGQ